MGNTREVNGNAAILARINKGWKPNRYLTNMSMAYFADPKDHVATSIFPICPVDFSTGFYYEFLKGDLARDNVARKPAFGKVSPAKMGHTDNSYKCVVDQIIVGVDQIGAINYQRAGVPASTQDVARYVLYQNSSCFTLIFYSQRAFSRQEFGRMSSLVFHLVHRAAASS